MQSDTVGYQVYKIMGSDSSRTAGINQHHQEIMVQPTMDYTI